MTADRTTSILERLTVSGKSAPRDGGVFAEGAEYLRRVAQRADGDPLCETRPIMLVVEVDGNFYETVRTVYLRGIYGRFSLLLRGILSREDWQDALRLCHRCFCELSEERREFNGYMPRGILIDSPLLLNMENASDGVDFFCLDYHRLCCLWGGKDSERIRRSAEKQMEDFFCRHPLPERSVLLRQAPDRETCSFLLGQQIGELILPSSEIPRIKGLLRNCTE